MRLFRVGEVLPGGVRLVRMPRPAPRGPLRRAGLAGFAGVSREAYSPPMPDGSPGSDVFPYDEHGTWGAGGPPSGGLAPPILGMPPTAPAVGGGPYTPPAVPNGISDPAAPFRWHNPTVSSQVPILASTPGNVPVLTLNLQRNLLVIQNNSTATAPDTTPVFYIGFGTPPAGQGLGVGLIAGIGIVFDTICPRDPIYILQVGGGGATLVVAGVVVQGTYSPD